MTPPLRIYGAGMSGLLAAQMLRHHRPEVLEAQLSLPDNHGALLRFRSNAVAEATGLPLQRVEVQKALAPAYEGGPLRTEATLADGNAYALKVTGEVMPRSVMNLAPGPRYIAPENFLALMARGTAIQPGAPLRPEDITGRHVASDPIISTIPMPVLMKIVGWSTPAPFRSRPVATFRARIFRPTVNVYQTIYFPGPDTRYYRASLTGSLLMVEYMCEEGDGPHGQPWTTDEMMDDAREVLALFGLQTFTTDLTDIHVKTQYYGKLIPIPDAERRAFILAMSDQLAIYSLGRFATWRQILLDDVVKDVRIIEGFLTQRSAYTRHAHWSRGQ